MSKVIGSSGQEASKALIAKLLKTGHLLPTLHCHRNHSTEGGSQRGGTTKGESHRQPVRVTFRKVPHRRCAGRGRLFACYLIMAVKTKCNSLAGAEGTLSVVAGFDFWEGVSTY
jgi:hypothetical protein